MRQALDEAVSAGASSPEEKKTYAALIHGARCNALALIHDEVKRNGGDYHRAWQTVANKLLGDPTRDLAAQISKVRL